MNVKRMIFGIGLAMAGLCLTACPKKDEPAGDTTPPPARRAAPPPAEGTPPPARRAAPLTAAQIVDKAIEANGGLAKLKAKFSRMEMTTKGTYHGMPYTSTLYFKAPDQHLMVIEPTKMEWGSSATECWQRIQGVVVDCNAMTREAMSQMNIVGSFSALYPLKEPGVTLTRTTLRSDAGLRNHLIRVQKGPVQAILYINKKTLRLTFVTYHGRWGQAMQQGQIALHYENFKTQEGVTFPTKTTMSFQGKPVMVEEVVSVKLGQVDETRLKRPPQLKFGEPHLQQTPAHHVAWTRVTAPDKQLEAKIMAGVNSLYGWAMKNGLKVLKPMPLIYFVKARRKKTTVEIRFVVMKPAKAVAKTKAMGVKAIKAHKIMWALHQGPFTDAPKWLKALKKRLRKQRKRTVGRGGLQPITDPRRSTDKATFLSAVFFQVR